MVLFLYFSLGANSVVKAVPGNRVATIEGFTIWCKTKAEGHRQFDGLPLYNGWLLALTYWDFIMKKA